MGKPVKGKPFTTKNAFQIAALPCQTQEVSCLARYPIYIPRSSPRGLYAAELGSFFCSMIFVFARWLFLAFFFFCWPAGFSAVLKRGAGKSLLPVERKDFLERWRWLEACSRNGTFQMGVMPYLTQRGKCK